MLLRSFLKEKTLIKVGIVGGTGYTGVELLRLLLQHSKVEVTAITSRGDAGTAVAAMFPSLRGRFDLKFEDPASADLKACDVVFFATPNGIAMQQAPDLLEAGVRVIDLAADFRIKDIAEWEKWYAMKHASPEWVAKAVYGLPEINRAAIKNAQLIANPGCYPTSIILGLAPVLKNKIVDVSTIIADSASGVSGAGRDPQVTSLFCEVDGGFKAYKVGKHRHMPEIEQELNRLAGINFAITFTPHLLPVKRGILSTVYATLKKDITLADLYAMYASFYEGEKFVRISPAGAYPNISSVCGSNYCDIGLALDSRTKRIIIISAIDNLIKGAAGQAVQNMNLVCSLAEDSGLNMPPLYP